VAALGMRLHRQGLDHSLRRSRSIAQVDQSLDFT
jgi:hypothetical protein